MSYSESLWPTLSFNVLMKTQNYTEILEVFMLFPFHSTLYLLPHKTFSLWFLLFRHSEWQPSRKQIISSVTWGESYLGKLAWISGLLPLLCPSFFWKINHVSSNKIVTLMLPVLLTCWPGRCKCKCRLWMHVQCLIFLGRILYNWNLSSPGDESKTNLRIKSHRGIIPKGNLL